MWGGGGGGHDPALTSSPLCLSLSMTAGEWISGSVCIYIARYLATPDPSNLMVRK